MTLLWLFVLLWLLGWVLAQVLVPAAIAWLMRFPNSFQSQPNRILLVCAMPWLIPSVISLAMIASAFAKSRGWLEDHCLIHTPDHPHFCFKHLPDMLMGHGHGHVVIAVSLFVAFGILFLRHRWHLYCQSTQLKTLTALARGKGLLQVVDDTRVMAFTANEPQPRVYLSQGLVNELSQREKRMVLAHEAAHIRGKDLLLSRWVEHLLLLHIKPCANLLRDLWRHAIEIRADEQVANRFGRVETAALLLKLTKSIQPAPVTTAMGGAKLMHRIQILLSIDDMAPAQFPAFEAAFFASLVVLMIGAFRGHHALESLLGLVIIL